MKIALYVWTVLCALYFPFYVTFYLLQVLARILLAISYFGLLDYYMGKNVIKSIFKLHGKQYY